MPKPCQPIDETAALADALNGMKTGQLQTKYRIGYARAAAITKKALEGSHGSIEQLIEEADDQATDDQPEVFELTLRIPVTRVDEAFYGLNPTREDLVYSINQLDGGIKAAIIEQLIQLRCIPAEAATATANPEQE